MDLSSLKHQTSKDDLSPEPALYEDEFCKLTKNSLILKKYFFPTASSKQIPLSAIQRLFYKKQQFPDDAFRSKDWGITLTPIWWGCDVARGVRKSSSSHYNVVVDTGTNTMKGFTVVKIEEFLESMHRLLEPSKFIPNTLPPNCLLQFLNKKIDKRIAGRESGKTEAARGNPGEKSNEDAKQRDGKGSAEYWKTKNQVNENTEELSKERDFDSVSNFSSHNSAISEKSVNSTKAKNSL